MTEQALQKIDEISSDVRVRLGTACVVVLVLLGGIMWLNAMHEKLTVAEHRIESLRANQQADKDQLEKRLDRIESKLDRVLERK